MVARQRFKVDFVIKPSYHAHLFDPYSIALTHLSGNYPKTSAYFLIRPVRNDESKHILGSGEILSRFQLHIGLHRSLLKPHQAPAGHGRAHSSRCNQQRIAYQPQMDQRIQDVALRSVFRPAWGARLAVAKLTLQHPERKLTPGSGMRSAQTATDYPLPHPGVYQDLAHRGRFCQARRRNQSRIYVSAAFAHAATCN